jgi:predicted nuclease of predicted toxin-antitoxin system
VKLLFDQNLSHRLCAMLADVFPDTQQAKRARLERASDDEIWKFAHREGYAIVTLDADFADIATLRGAPPKIIWLRCGNQPTDIIANLIRQHADIIAGFGEDADTACLQIY